METGNGDYYRNKRFVSQMPLADFHPQSDARLARVTAVRRQQRRIALCLIGLLVLAALVTVLCGQLADWREAFSTIPIP